MGKCPHCGKDIKDCEFHGKHPPKISMTLIMPTGANTGIVVIIPDVHVFVEKFERKEADDEDH